MDFIDYRDPRPIYEQIAERYKTLILKNVLSPGEQMPSVRSLAVELSTNPNTVQKAYAALERDGFIYTVKGKGNYVSGSDQLMEDKKKELADRMKNLLKEADELGLDPRGLVRDSLDQFEAGMKKTKAPDAKNAKAPDANNTKVSDVKNTQASDTNNADQQTKERKKTNEVNLSKGGFEK